MSPIIVAFLALLGVIGATVLPVWLLNRQQQRARAEDQKAQEKRDAAEKDRQKEVADQANKAADLLVKANELVATTLEASDVRKGKAEEEVARVAAETAAAAPIEARGMLVTLVYPNGQRQDVRLIGAPRTGDHIRTANGASDPSWVVVLIMWAEAKQGREPAVVAVVRPYRETEDETPVPPGADGVEEAVQAVDTATGLRR